MIDDLVIFKGNYTNYSSEKMDEEMKKHENVFAKNGFKGKLRWDRDKDEIAKVIRDCDIFTRYFGGYIQVTDAGCGYSHIRILLKGIYIGDVIKDFMTELMETSDVITMFAKDGYIVMGIDFEYEDWESGIKRAEECRKFLELQED